MMKKYYTCLKDTKSVLEKLDENYANNLYTEYDIDVLKENTQVTIESAIDIEECPSDYLEYLRDIIDEYNSSDAPWLNELGN